MANPEQQLHLYIPGLFMDSQHMEGLDLQLTGEVGHPIRLTDILGTGDMGRWHLAGHHILLRVSLEEAGDISEGWGSHGRHPLEMGLL